MPAICTVSSGRIIQNGKRVRALGVNCPDLFIKWIGTDACNASSPPSSYMKYTSISDINDTFYELSSRNIRFIRFSFIGPKPNSHLQGYINNNATWLANLDALVASAEFYGMYLIPTGFSGSAIPYYIGGGETLRSAGINGSATQAAYNSMWSSVINRYKNSSAIAYWEYSNEIEGPLTNPPSTPFYPPDASMGTPAAYSDADGFLYETAGNATLNFHTNCKTNDPARMTASGNSGWHFNNGTESRNNLDLQMKRLFTHDKTDSITIHPYESHGLFYTNGYRGLGAYLSAVKVRCAAANKPLILGEFGCSSTYTSTDTPTQTTIQIFEKILNEVTNADIDLALVWSYAANTDCPTDWYMNAKNGNRADFLNVFTQYAQSYNS